MRHQEFNEKAQLTRLGFFMPGKQGLFRGIDRRKAARLRVGKLTAWTKHMNMRVGRTSWQLNGCGRWLGLIGQDGFTHVAYGFPCLGLWRGLYALSYDLF